MLTRKQKNVKRIFDVALASLGLVATGWLIILAALASRWETGRSGIFRQVRFGCNGRLFEILKIRTMREIQGLESCVTTSSDPRITRLGKWLRKTKIDELPQLVNVLRGDMSFVGPRPDVPEMIQAIQNVAPEVLMVRPGITGPASLKYRHEEQLLAESKDPESLNAEQIFPDKIQINVAYVRNYSFWSDMKYLWQTLAGRGAHALSAERQERENHERYAA